MKQMLTTIALPSFMQGGLSLALILSTIPVVTSVKLSVTPTLVIANIVEPLHLPFICSILPFTSLHIGVKPKVTMISYTFHELIFFITLVAIMAKTHVQSKPIENINVQVIIFIELIPLADIELRFKI
jgi:hypothetical protein